MRRLTAEDILMRKEVVRYPAKRFTVTPEVRVYPFTPPFATKFAKDKNRKHGDEVIGLCEVVDSKGRVLAAALSHLEANFITSALNIYTEMP